MESLNKSQTFDWPKLFIRAEYGPKIGRKYSFQESGVVLHSFNIQLLLIKLVSSLNLKV